MHHQLCKGGHWVFELWSLLLVQQMTGAKERHLWLMQDIELGEALKQGALPPDILIEDVG